MVSHPALIAIDIDGTLLPSDAVDISVRNRRALEAATAAGIEIAIATGRRHRYAAPILERAQLPGEMIVITSNGSVTRTLTGGRIDRFTLPIAAARGLSSALRQFGGATVFTFDHEGPGELVVESLEQLHERIQLWVQANRESLREIKPLERAFDAGEAPIQGMICGPVRAMREAEVWLSGSEFMRQIEVQRTEYPERDLTILDLLPPGCSKGAALARLSETRGLASSRVMAIGDNWNDEKMLEWAGHPVVMSNGAPDLVEMAQNRGWRIAPSNDEDGVAQVIEQVIEHISAERHDSQERPVSRQAGVVECS
ncbi:MULTISPECIES: HAD-IIB family hydrolase [Acidobacterium]|uniref:HAD-superfamily hydrolase, subfamily IIB n=1 Tax=Acidobacterium capsulatum (strain ATCC 51196 / DSM 11244 / BCRC 80197 / JCM 7670 / NBRC 15755 / NCIMB 13165 / 161) TaxID=240015 RepID=C1F7L8_ACIC5|nr:MULTISPECIES: HAD-IIB family hydrolase [Acidobacterium]ACO32354.1 HAD-superfamily hydrolase, subfamily IIB [Acidobacterium capsulatum ATCC 51196]HCT59639.1 HAD-IIB family hydrolase [Acidobacterium sp.]